MAILRIYTHLGGLGHRAHSVLMQRALGTSSSELGEMLPQLHGDSHSRLVT
jgi:hypothetical protein